MSTAPDTRSSDALDFACMLAWGELSGLQHCGGSGPLSPAQRAEIDLGAYEACDGTSVREQVEDSCGVLS